MPDLNPLRLWRRLLALPNDSQTKTLTMALVVSAVCAVVVSGAAVMLRPLQEAQRADRQQARLEEVLTGPGKGVASAGAGTLETLMVDLATGLKVTGVDPAGFDMRAAAADEATSTRIPAEFDLARIGRRSNVARIEVLRSDRGLEMVVLPVYGTGYQSTILAYLALRGDLRTVASLKVVEHGETPGIGARIEDPAWQQLWPGKQLVDDAGQVRLAVVRGASSSVYEVDGITGATRTGNGITNMVRFWLGEHGYGPVLENLRKGRL